MTDKQVKFSDVIDLSRRASTRDRLELSGIFMALSGAGQVSAVRAGVPFEVVAVVFGLADVSAFVALWVSVHTLSMANVTRSVVLFFLWTVSGAAIAGQMATWMIEVSAPTAQEVWTR